MFEQQQEVKFIKINNKNEICILYIMGKRPVDVEVINNIVYFHFDNTDSSCTKILDSFDKNEIYIAYRKVIDHGSYELSPIISVNDGFSRIKEATNRIYKELNNRRK